MILVYIMLVVQILVVNAVTTNMASGRRLVEVCLSMAMVVDRPRFRVELLRDNPFPKGVLGSKAIGEPPFMLPCCIPLNARARVRARRLCSHPADKHVSGWHTVFSEQPRRPVPSSFHPCFAQAKWLFTPPDATL